MNEERGLEDFFSQRLENQSFPFKEEDWISFEKKLEAMATPPKAITTLKAILPGLLILFVAVIGFITGYWFKGKQIPSLPASDFISFTSDSYSPSLPLFAPTICVEPNPTLPSIFKNSTVKNIPFTSFSTQRLPTLNNLESLQNKVENWPILLPISDPDEFTTKLISHHGTWNYFSLAQNNQDYKADGTNSNKSEIANHEARFRILLSTGTDASHTQLPGKGTVAGTLGFRTGVRVFPKIYVMSGVFFTNKKYQGNGEMFSPPTDFWKVNTNGRIPDTIEGSCHVVDIPLQLTYEKTLGKKSSLYITSGIHYFWMLDEKYKYSENSSSYLGNGEWSSRENRNEGLAAFTSSIAWSTPLIASSRLVVEPYLRLPLTGIGWGQINLYSSGVLVSMEWKIKTKNKN